MAQRFLMLRPVGLALRALLFQGGEFSPRYVSTSKELRHAERQHRIQPFITGDDALVLDVERDSARHLENALGSADGPQRRSLAALLVAPYAEIGIVAGQGLIGGTVRRKNKLLGRIDREWATQGARTLDDHLRLHIPAGRAIKNKKTGSTRVSPAATAARPDNQQIVHGIDRQGIKTASNIRAFEQVTGVNLIFSDGVNNPLPLSDTLADGVYSPTDYNTNATFDIPAPAPPSAAGFSPTLRYP